MQWSWSPATSLKKTLTQLFFHEYFEVLGAASFIEQLRWLVLNYILVLENNLKKKEVSGEIAFALISLFHYKYKNMQAGQLAQEYLYFLQRLLNFVITKYIKQKVDDNLTIYMDEHSPCGLSVTGDIKICQCCQIKM